MLYSSSSVVVCFEADAASLLRRVLKLMLRCIAAGMSAVVARTCVAPFERVKLEMVLHQRQSEGTLRVAWSVLQQEGLRGLWKGNLLNLFRTAPQKVGPDDIHPSFSHPPPPSALSPLYSHVGTMSTQHGTVFKVFEFQTPLPLSLLMKGSSC